MKKSILLGIMLSTAIAASAQYSNIANGLTNVLMPALSGSSSYKGFVDAAYTQGVGRYRSNFATISTSQGYQLNSWLFMGAGIGVDLMWSYVNGFIRRYQAIGAKTKNSLYQLIDNFTLFYFKFMEGRKNTDANYWSKIQMTPVFYTWSGLAFERVCLLHSEQIKKALGISGVITNEYSWRTAANDEHPGAQIDLLIDRSDKVINLCEIKYSDSPYTIDKKYMENLRNKVGLFRRITKTRKGIALTMITSSGLVKNAYSMNGIHSQVTADDLFTDA